MKDRTWNVMARLYPGSVPVPCKDADGRVLVLATEDEAERLARKYRGNSGTMAGGGPHYFAQEAS